MIQFTDDAEVLNAKDESVGTIDRVVIDPNNKEVSHIVVQRGIFFTTEKVVPMKLFDNVSEDQVTLKKNVKDLDDFPDFEETHYVSTDVRGLKEPSSSKPERYLYWYPPFGATGLRTGGIGYDPLPPYVKKTEENIPEGTIALPIGAKVYGTKGEHVGNIERIFIDPHANRAIHLLISEGFILKTKKLVPTMWIKNAYDDSVYLSVDSDFIDSLPDYLEE